MKAVRAQLAAGRRPGSPLRALALSGCRLPAALRAVAGERSAAAAIERAVIERAPVYPEIPHSYFYVDFYVSAKAPRDIYRIIQVTSTAPRITGKSPLLAMPYTSTTIPKQR